ncbi:MAG: adenylate/guanylate cyclase domain-containing protein, partial [Methylococcales bacterium]|nr:adenylate/guanylate cyclase domain-containing protein [Methylococcales bacterium]
TVIGDTVNLAARLESANKYYGSEILISEFTFEQIKDVFMCRELDKVRVQGKQQPVAIYEVVGEKDRLTTEQLTFCLAFAEALTVFRNQRFGHAKILFTELVERYHDGASALYLQRLDTQEMNTVSAKFEAIYELPK